MPCNDWSALLQRYRAAVKAYNDAAQSLSAVPGTQFNRLWHRAETARTEAGLARAALLNHEHDHACPLEERSAKQAAVFQPSEEWTLGDQGQPGG